ncbi:hypothetical protein PHJA_000941400 [Phtheirospermum japonicum]|uniref:Uncharacterized protein n=1 Tax=Phtheirospermum japonicum TaxID=374723 RepID=A0A830BKL0_9LAMI|nr:hypothetical protein PHJA_000941400 [Phtheirospermum japonicum]
MAGNNKQKKSSSFSLFSLFKGRGSSRARAREETRDEYVKAYKVYPSDEDRGRWVAEPGIDKKASAYISLTTDRWEKLG